MMRRAPRERGERSSGTGSVRRARRYATCWCCGENPSRDAHDPRARVRRDYHARSVSAPRAADQLRGGTAGSRSARRVFRRASRARIW